MASFGNACYCHCLMQVTNPQTVDSGTGVTSMTLPDLVLLAGSSHAGEAECSPVCECSSIGIPPLMKNLGEFPRGGVQRKFERPHPKSCPKTFSLHDYRLASQDRLPPLLAPSLGRIICLLRLEAVFISCLKIIIWASH